MSETPRPGFDGGFIADLERNLAWLIIGGCRYHIDPAASDAMMRPEVVAEPAPELVEDIPYKGAIRTGSQLVRGEPYGPIYLFAVDVPDNRLHPVVSWESFVDFGFDISKVSIVPDALLRGVPAGVEICSAMDRLKRRGHSMYLPLLEVLS